MMMAQTMQYASNLISSVLLRRLCQCDRDCAAVDGHNGAATVLGQCEWYGTF